jgi:hypothetical protein
MKHSRTYFPLGRAVACALPIALSPLLSAAPQTDVKVPAPLQGFDVDADKSPWVAPPKGATVPQDLTHLSAEERAAFDAALQRRPGDPGASSSPSAKPEPASELPVFGTLRDPRQHFQIDTPGDGQVWVFGGTYKASFGDSGATYVPAFGSRAPRNFPLTFRIDAVTIGGDLLALDHHAAPALEGRTVEFHRGPCTERYDVALGQVEQSFVFDVLPVAGELVVELGVESELVPMEAANGITFVGEHGRVDYSRAVAIDGQGRRLELATTLVDGEVHIVVPEAFLTTAVTPLVIDPVITTWTPNAGPTDDFQADIAYDASFNRFLVVYERAYSATDHDVWGELFDPSTGAAIAGSGVYVDFTSSYWEAPRCANNRLASQFLVVATRRGAPDEIWGRTREADDTTQGAQFQVSSGSGSKLNPDVGGDPELSGPTYYCVVWERTYSVGIDHDVHARLVTSGGALLGTSPVLIDNSGGTYDKWPTISKHDGLAPFPSQAWNIVWGRMYSPTDWDIRGAQVRWDGLVITPTFSLDANVYDHRLPEVSASLTPTADGRPYAAVYELYTQNRVEIVANVVSGNLVSSRVNLSQALGTPAGLSDILPAVETDGNHFAVTFSQQYQPGSSDYDMYACGLYYAGAAIHISESLTNLAYSSTYEGNGRVTALYGSGYTSTWFGVVWTDSAGVGNIEAATYSLFEGFGPFVGARYCSPAVPNSTGVGGRIEAQGAGYAGGFPLHLVAYSLPQNVFCYFLASPATAATTTPATSGVVCVGNPLSRFNAQGQVGNTGGAGRIDLDIDTLAIPLPTGGVLALTAGTTFNFQAWYRDGATNNLTDAVAVLFR